MFGDLTNVLRKDYPQVYFSAVHQHDEGVFYYDKANYKNKVRTIRSVTKSFIGALYGIALYQGHLKNLDERIIHYLPEYQSVGLDPKIGDVTFRHLLSMTSGFDCSDQKPKGFFTSKNWTRFYIERPITQSPGTCFRYSSASSHLLSALLYKLTDLNVYDFAKANLFYPLGIGHSKWGYDKQGYYLGGFGLDLAPSSMTSLGHLYLHDGVVAGQRLISESYIRESCMAHSAGGFPENDGYGYQWWIGKAIKTDYFYAAGLGGQYCFVVPEYQLVVTITSESKRPHIENKAIFTDLILPCFTS